jgi:subtilase family serine protease
MTSTGGFKRLRGSLLGGCVALAVVSPPLIFSPQAASAQPAKAVHDVCGPVPAGHARCLSKIVTGTSAAAPSGLNPADLESAYALPSLTAGVGQTVGIVDAFDSPSAESDLAVYRAEFGLPPCTTANGCFRKVDENGGSSYPKPNAGWGFEIAIDLDMVSAICPNCHILLVEGTTNNIVDLGVAENTAASLGVNEISNSWGSNDQSKDATLDSLYFTHPGIAITVASGDSGYHTFYPASSANVTAVGGTSLTPANNPRGWTETAWSFAGSGCTSYEPQPAWQTANSAIPAVCANRTVADVAAVADPHTGPSVYDTLSQRGWLLGGGTSAASPIIASVYALAGNAASTVAGSYPYSHTTTHNKTNLNDVTSGSNGNCGTALCIAQAGWDGPTGLGTPNGIGAF